MTNDLIDELFSYHADKCSRLKHGRCSSLLCLKRGGYVRGENPDYDKATCEEYETVQLSKEWRRNNQKWKDEGL